MRVKFWASIFAVAILTGVFAQPLYAATKMSNCIVSMEETISEGNRKPCEVLATKRKTNPRQRAEIYFQLGLAEQQSRKSANEILSSIEVERSWYDKAIAADPTFSLPYFFAAETLQSDDSLKAASYLRSGLEKSPDDILLMAQLSSVEYGIGDHVASAKLCKQVLVNSRIDVASGVICGEVFGWLQMWPESYSAFSAASQSYQPDKRNFYGWGVRIVPVQGMAQALAAQGKHQEAVDLMSKYLVRKDIGYEASRLRGDYSQYLAAVGKFSEAADEVGKLAKGRQMDTGLELRVQQMIFLAQAGRAKEATEVAELIYGPAPLKFVLKLQVKLRNAHFDELPMTGKFDEATKTALQTCLTNPTCFTSVVGRKI